MQAKKTFKNIIKTDKARHTICIALILVVCFLVLGFIAYEKLPVAADKSISQMVCDGTDGLTDNIGAQGSLEQTFVLPANTPLYGVMIRTDIAARVQHGIINVELLKDGAKVAHSSDDLTTLIDGANKGFLFNEKQLNEQNEIYTLKITIKPETEQDGISFYKADKAPTKDFTLMVNGKNVNGSIALKFLINHTGNFIYTAYFVIAGFIILSLIAIYVFIFILKAKAHTIFLLMALSIGVVFCFITPQRSAPDEYVHIASSYANASVLLGQVPKDEAGNLLVRKCDAVKDFGLYRDYSLYAWKETYDGLFKKGDTKTMVPVAARTADIFPLAYGAQTLGVLIARLLNFGYIPMLLMGRLFNLLQYIVLAYMAIRIMPFAKTTLTLIAALPMSLQLAGSFSYDAYVLGLAFLFIALCINFAFTNKQVGAKQLVALCVIAALLAPAKSVYILLAAFCFIIPKDKIVVFKKLSRRHSAVLFKAIIILCSLLIWLGYNVAVMKNLFSTVSAVPNLPISTGTSQSESSSHKNGLEQNEQIQQAPLSHEPLSEPAKDTQAQIMQLKTQAKTISEPPQEILSQDAVTDSLKNDILENGDSRHYFTFGYILTHIPQTIKMLANTVQQNTALYLQGLIGGRLGEIIVTKIEISWLFVIILLITLLMSCIANEKEKLQYNGISRVWGYLIAAGVAGLIVLACVTWTPINYKTVFGIQGRYFLPVLPLVLFGLRSNKIIAAQKSFDGALCFIASLVNALIILNVFCILT